ncbi:two-component system OmpR family response regulator [Stackebrandtia albiflava]|uniref:Two-component system OmpR family response regulator n=1 Tax=Stackebrandtia albiflava TaxID=406432 RepID=A0A562VEC4_9ACTN|nr:response regulator transcription factor [Stackebrandtia albiflava]TWJ16215.1 two-component system OmpR family response regulator [Stackebrandtia albiflava]
MPHQHFERDVTGSPGPRVDQPASGRPSAPRHEDGTPARLLVVDDEPVLAELLLDSLTFAGYQVQVARSGSEAMQVATQARPDLMVLDVNLPDFNGFVVAARLRAAGHQVPIVFLTARDAPTDLRDGFGAGGDDYLTKPFRLEELCLRVEAVLRRTMDRTGSFGNTVAVADIVLDMDSRQVWRGSRPIDLSPTEFRLLHHLAVNSNKVLSRADLLRHVWGYETEADSSIVETYISYLRRKVDSTDPALIHTVRGAGYILRVPRP